ncbi:McrBC 5-methylcytosine restriction system component [Butyrivibrio sp. Su6]|uniref:hypothetical protein n=1 Tax=Butyrivibrio sp. Su6 TaxID=1520810 RepID=UPI00089F28C6|nr:hypothetical protein [Butyrivibrio sp. Su6]SEF62023.1 McrBC 5-methylcytosine restriction system component [Butyrivibrio sp. Su6]
MDKLLFKMPCLTESRYIPAETIYETFFDKEVRDKRNLEADLQKMIMLNQEAFKFLDIRIQTFGSGSNLSVSFVSSKYVGAIPIKMPYDGIAHKDFQVYPRFTTGNDTFFTLTNIINELDFVVEPEYETNMQLNLPYQLNAPMYNDALQYIYLFKRVVKYKWRRFNAIETILPYPVSGTHWDDYAMKSSNPNNSLLFPCNRNVLAMNHKEWQELVYVLNLAKNIITSSSAPGNIRYKFQSYYKSVENSVRSIIPRPVKKVFIHAGDPICVKELKEQANRILQMESSNSMAWRIDMSMLFERYAQYVFGNSVKQLAGKMLSNSKISGKGAHMKWGVKYLEPDMIALFQDKTVFADAKYKANMYSVGTDVTILKETYRHDLHQILAYCSFEPQRDKTGYILYPSDRFTHYEVTYKSHLDDVSNKVVLCGIPFDAERITETIFEIKDLISNNL